MVTFKTITLEQYIRCTCDGELNVLGEGTEQEIKDAWEQIQLEYLGAIKDTTTTQIFTLEDEALYLELEIKFVLVSVHILRVWRDDEHVKLLQSKGYPFEFSATDTKAYHKDLDRVEKRSTRLKTQLANINHERAQLMKEQEGEPATRANMYHNIAVFSKFMQYAIDERTTTLEKYASIRNLYYKHVELNTKKK